MNFPPVRLLRAACVLLVASATPIAPAQSVAGFVLAKIQNYRQTSPAAPVVNSAAPFQFASEIFPGTATLNSGTLTFSGGVSPRGYTLTSNGDLQILDTFTTQAQMDAAYPSNINYTVNMNTSAGNFSRSVLLFGLLGYPVTPTLTVPLSDWQSGNIVFDPAFNYTFTWNAFSNANTADIITFVIRNTSIAAQLPATATSFTVNGGTLAVNSTFQADLAFVRVAGASTADADVGMGVAALARDNNFTIATVPEPSAFALIGLGAILFAVIRVRVRR